MQLFHSPTTPFGRKVAVLIHEAGLADRITVTEVSGSPLDPGTMPIALNPLGKIPTLVVDGRAIFDSRVICRYLDDLAGAGLYPSGPALWPVLTLEAVADGILDAALVMVYELRMRPADKVHAPWLEGQWQKVARALAHVETDWMDLLDGPLTMAHVAIACALGYLDLRHADRNWRGLAPRLASWEAGISQRPSLLQTLPKT